MKQDEFRAEDGLLVVPVGPRVPAVCLHCGASEDVVYHVRTQPLGSHDTRVTSKAAASGAPLGILGAIAISKIFRNYDLLLNGIIASAVAGIVIWVSVSYRSSPKVQLRLPFCQTCNAMREKRQRWIRFISLGLGVSLLVLFAGTGLHVSGLAVAGGALLAAFVAAFVILGRSRRTYAITAWANEHEVALEVEDKIAREVVRRAGCLDDTAAATH